MNHSTCISHPANTRYLQIHEWQIKFCQGSHCAALLLSFFSGWHDWKIKNDYYYRKSNDIAEMHGDERLGNEDAYLFFSMEELIEGTLNFYGKKSIQEGLDLLVSLEVITVHQNPNPRYNFDKTKYFKFYPEICNQWIKANYESQVVDFSDRAKVANRLGKNALPSGENDRPSGKNARYITNTTNNTTSNKKSLTTRENFSEKINPPSVSAQEVMEKLIAKGFPSKRFQFQDSVDLVEELLSRGATWKVFEKAFDLSEERTSSGFGMRYLAKVVEGLLEVRKDKEIDTERIYTSDFSRGLHWMGDLLEEEEHDEFAGKSGKN